MAKRLLQIWLLLFFCMSILSSASLAASNVQFELIDGSIIKGTIGSFKDGVYSVQTQTLGKVTIPVEKIRLIKYIAPPSPAGSAVQSISPELTKQIDVISRALTSNPESMQSIINLQHDPDFQAVLKDEAIMRAVQNLELDSLLDNQSFLKLLEKEEVKTLLENIK